MQMKDNLPARGFTELLKGDAFGINRLYRRHLLCCACYIRQIICRYIEDAARRYLSG